MVKSEERIKFEQYTQLMRTIGPFGDWDGDILPEISTKKPFSKHYESYEDYINERNNFQKDALDGKPLDHIIHTKLRETYLELGDKTPTIIG